VEIVSVAPGRRQWRPRLSDGRRGTGAGRPRDPAPARPAPRNGPKSW